MTQPTPPSAIVVDDDPTHRALSTHALQALGYVVEEVADGYTALDLINRALPALVVCDVRMPRMDGISLTRNLRAKEGTRDVPVVVVSALADNSLKQRALDAGARAFLPKPVTRASLAECLVKAGIDLPSPPVA